MPDRPDDTELLLQSLRVLDMVHRRISTKRMTMLIVLKLTKADTMEEISRRTGWTPDQCNDILKNLRKLGLVDVEKIPQDRTGDTVRTWRYRYTLSAAGLELIAEVTKKSPHGKKSTDRPSLRRPRSQQGHP